MRINKLQSLIKPLGQECTLRDSRVVIDGKSYFQNLYKESRCQHILGGEYDRFADHLKKQLTYLKESNVTCFVIFGGAMKTDITGRLELHQKVINQADSVTPKENNWNEPAFLKDVFRQILDEMEIKYATCEYDSLYELVNAAKYYKCSVITRNFEYAFFGISCIPPQSMSFDPETKSISGKFYDCNVCRPQIAFELQPSAVFLILMDENNDYLMNLERLIGFNKKNFVFITRRWVRRHKIEVILSDISKNLNQEQKKNFLQDYNFVKSLILPKARQERTAVVNHFDGQVKKEHVNWFVEGLVEGKIATSYVNLKNNNIFSGSWLVFDGDKEDAMVPSMKIVEFSHALLTDFQKSTITFIGRVGKKSRTSEFTSENFSVQSIPSYYFKKDLAHIPDYYNFFLAATLPGFDINMLNGAPEDSKLLIISLVFYVCRVNKDFLAAVYSILLSYVMLGSVTRITGLLKRSNFLLLNGNTSETNVEKANEISKRDGFTVANDLINLFYLEDIKKVFDRKILHKLAEFQHCLQQMNYLNRLCGQKIKCTIYHETYNATFIYNVLRKLDDVENPLHEVENTYLRSSTSVLNYFKHLVNIFDNIVAAVKP